MFELFYESWGRFFDVLIIMSPIFITTVVLSMITFVIIFVIERRN